MLKMVMKLSMIKRYLLIQEEYRRQKLKESLIGPVISTLLHIVLLVLCAAFFVGENVKKNETVEITSAQEDIPTEEPPPPPPPPEIPPPEPQEVVSHDPQVTSDAVPDAADLVGAIDDVSDEPPSTDDSAESDLVNDIKPSASSIVSSKMYGGRSAAGRAGSLKTYGGQVAAQQALHKAMSWLAKVQNPDGSWGEKVGARPAGMTGLGLLVFLAHGETSKSKTYGETVSRAIQWLANDKIMTAGQSVYAHAIKTYALSEAYSMTGNYELFERVNDLVKIIIAGQQAKGGFDYNFSKDESRQDVSVAGWNYQALKAAKLAGVDAAGLDAAIAKSINYLKELGANSESGDGFPYNAAGNKTQNHHTTRGVGVLCLQLFGAGQTPEIRDELHKISTYDYDRLDWDKAPKGSLYGWYYATQCMFQAGGKMWKSWNSKFQKMLEINQNPIGYWTWPSKGHAPFDDLTKKIYATCLCSLMLTVYYRHLPMSAKAQPTKIGKKNVDKARGEEDIDIF